MAEMGACWLSQHDVVSQLSPVVVRPGDQLPVGVDGRVASHPESSLAQSRPLTRIGCEAPAARMVSISVCYTAVFQVVRGRVAGGGTVRSDLAAEMN